MRTGVEIDGVMQTLNIERINRSNPISKGDEVLTRDPFKGRFCRATVIAVLPTRVRISVDPGNLKSDDWYINKSELSDQAYKIT